VVAVTLVATALCADRAASAAPAIRPQVTQLAGRLVTRLSHSFRRTIPAVRLYAARRDGFRAAVTFARPVASAPLVPQPLSPFQFRLPPPIV